MSWSLVTIGVVTYVFVLVSTLLLYKHEMYVLLCMCCAFIILCYFASLPVIFASVIVGIGMSVVSYICVKVFKLWKHNFAHSLIPYWMPIAWALVAMLSIGVHNIMLSQKL